MAIARQVGKAGNTRLYELVGVPKMAVDAAAKPRAKKRRRAA